MDVSSMLPRFPTVVSDAPLSEYSQRRYHAYPHANGFADGGASIVLGQLEEGAASLWKVDLSTGREAMLARFVAPAAPAFRPELWFDVAAHADVLVTVAEGAVQLVDVRRPGRSRELFRGSDGMNVQALPSITADGSRVVVYFERAGVWGVLAIDVASGKTQTLVQHAWMVGHCHFLPHDPEWVMYCHEGRCDTVPDRMWAWHARHAPQGKVLFDQASDVPGVPLQVGHEVGCQHENAAIVVAYGASPRGPRGVYEIFLDGRPPRLVSAADRDLHCNVSRDGRWIVVDTSGPHDLPGRGWEDAQARSDVLLSHPPTGQRQLLAHSGIRSHPWHPHPTFSPDGHAIVLGEADGDMGRVRLLRLSSAV